MNSTLSPITASLELHFVDLDSDWEYKEQIGSITLLPNQSTDLLIDAPCRGPNKRPEQEQAEGGNLDKWTGCTSSTVVVGVRLVDPESKEVLARTTDWPQPYRFINPPDPGIKVEYAKTGGEVSVSSKRPAKCAVLTVVGEGGGFGEVRWGDNALDLMPEDPQTIKVIGDVGGKEVNMVWFGNEKGFRVKL